MTTRRWIVFIAVLGIAAVVGLRLAYLHPLWMSESALRSWILEKEPFGSSEDHVRELFARHGWQANYEWRGESSDDARSFPGVRGEHIIGAYLGHYQGLPFRVDIDAFWGFDGSGRLVDLRVRKMTDAP